MMSDRELADLEDEAERLLGPFGMRVTAVSDDGRIARVAVDHIVDGAQAAVRERWGARVELAFMDFTHLPREATGAG